ncbi:hypothetical protein ECG_00325 [Echinococcus granulosus]|nr:hypothetical protein ECG_00322 [Echinococcus granulosus]KAH9287231.1 hypothetical protein ECG_00320 [Echinococcus granulosus]KAH9287234.1 hypothetical protein ECG_00327 [Echinococcus granulosus]KAH9287236.1 hypothetical protein ECG_00325 [Echinococcus granulosus]
MQNLVRWVHHPPGLLSCVHSYTSLPVHSGLPATLYIRILTLTILPMIMTNIITGKIDFPPSIRRHSIRAFLLPVFAGLNPKENGKMSGVTLAYIFAFHLLSLLIGLIYSLLIKPGKKAHSALSSISTNSMPPVRCCICSPTAL